jgi:PiT family inorganic phosphate transporter
MDLFVITAGIVLALLFNFVNGLNDAANSIATIIATKALSPLKAVVLASVFNLVGPLVFTTAIAKTIGKGIVDPVFLTPNVLLAAMFGAVLWVFLSSYFGIPVSSSHALIGGLLGAGVAVGGFEAILLPAGELVREVLVYAMLGGVLFSIVYSLLRRWKDGEWKNTVGIGFITGFSLTIPLLIITGAAEIKGIFAVVIFILVSPMLGFIAAFMFGLVIMRVFYSANPTRLNRAFKPLQIVAGSFQAIGHGSNDAQNAMGVITAILVSAGILSDFTVPLWVILVSCSAIALGTMLGGWRVVDKMANKITKIRPYQGFSASTAGGGVLSLMTAFGVPVSTTHAMTGSIMGVGSTRGYSAVKWGIVREIVAAWVLTIPASAVVAGACYALFSMVLVP